MNTKHTPGPWTVSTAPGTVDVRAFDGRFVANVDCDKRTALVEIDANARLIAAAPTLFAALQMIADSDASAIDAKAIARKVLAETGVRS